MRAIVMAVLTGLILSLGNGCCSYLVYQGSKQEIKERAFRAQALQGGGAGVGLDLFAMDALAEHPFLQIGAALLDAGSIYGIGAAAAATQDRGSHKDKTTTINISGNGNNTSVVTGEGNYGNGTPDNSSRSGQ